MTLPSGDSSITNNTNQTLNEDEKRRLRREKLAALRQKKLAEAQNGEGNKKQEGNGTGTGQGTGNVTADLTTKRNEKQKVENSFAKLNSTSIDHSSTETQAASLEEKQRLLLKRQGQRIEDWKKNRSADTASHFPQRAKENLSHTRIAITKKSTFKLPKIKRNNNKRVFGFVNEDKEGGGGKEEEDEEEEFTKKKILKIANDDARDYSNYGEKFPKPVLEEAEDDLDQFIESISKSESFVDNNNGGKQVQERNVEEEKQQQQQLEQEQEQDQEQLEKLPRYLAVNNNNNEDTDEVYKYEEDFDDEFDEDDEDDINKRLSAKLNKLQNTAKELKEIDHTSIEYPKFRKHFYQVPFEMSTMDNRELDMLRLELDNVRARGKNVPPPFLTWGQLLMPESVMSVIQNDLGFAKPSPIQCQAIPIVLSGRDMIGVAKTGSGKTLSYVLPMVRHIQDQLFPKPGEGPIGLVLSPTRELALQIEKEILKFSSTMDLKVCCCYGGSNIENQISELKRGVNVIVATPGRLIDLLAANGGRITTLRRTTFVVLDEADRMFDMGFEPQIQKIFTQIRPDKQTVLFSATFPRKLEQLAKKVLHNPIEIIVGGVSVVASEISQEIILFEDTDQLMNHKIQKLEDILSRFFDLGKNTGKVLVFVEKQTDADKLVSVLLKKAIPCIAIHGGKDQIDRKHAIREFSDDQSGINVLIATSIAARGLDVRNLDLVVNFEPPSHLEDYVHRVGRTGRAGKHGEAITFVDNTQEKEISILVKALKMSSRAVDSKLQEIADKFMKKIESGEEKRSSGFGGKGLEKLQNVRETNMQLQKKMFGNFKKEDGKKSNRDLSEQVDYFGSSSSSSSFPSSSNTTTTTTTTSTASAIEIPTFEIIEGNSPETSGPDKCKFYCRVTINDLPQKVRWGIVQRESLSKIIEASKTSITTRGQFYPPQSKQTPTNDQPKLYLLIEGLTRKAVEEAAVLIRDKMLQGVEAMRLDNHSAPTGRYVV